MFEDLDEDKAAGESRARMGVSAAISGVIFLGVGGALAAAIATAHAVVAPRVEEMVVEFADMPMPEPEPEIESAPVVEAAAPERRPQRRRASSRPPDEIPDERPEEADGELGEAGDVGPVDGFLEGEEGVAEVEPAPVVAPEPPPRVEPRQVRDSITRPRFVSGCRTPEIPEALHGQAETIRIEVRLLVGTDGRVANASVVESHPLISDEIILSCARAQTFEPAQLGDGTAIPYPFRRRFVFRPSSV